MELRVERTSPPSPHRSGRDRDYYDYKELADRLGLEPSQTIHRLGEALETLMKDDVTANRPDVGRTLREQVAARLADEPWILAPPDTLAGSLTADLFRVKPRCAACAADNVVDTPLLPTG